jgi:hypothetical protein
MIKLDVDKNLCNCRIEIFSRAADYLSQSVCILYSSIESQRCTQTWKVCRAIPIISIKSRY